ncbi:helix-turn-helix domain-containing protein [Pseudonocardia phyllosphaerae]|uniref:helix-turn-helix domain-containing protein n=1 Tax=Pseudonocardia phyllosphaerae TaxID=3390502 RepID=UPI00397CDF05
MAGDASELATIGEVAERFGLTTATLRYWEDRGLITPEERRSGRRRYGPDQMHRIGLIQMWQNTGLMSLDEIGAILTGGVPADGGWRAVVLDRIQAIDEQLRILATGRAHLEHLLTCPRDNPAVQCERLRTTVQERMAGNDVTPDQVPAPRP